MADKILSLSQEDAEALRKLIRDARQNPRPPARYRETQELGQSPDIYIARTPVGGIAASTEEPGTGTGSGSGTSGQGMLSYADCDVYRKVELYGYSELVPTGIVRRVFNISTTAVPGDEWIIIERDKFGTWVAIRPMSSGSSDVSWSTTTSGILDFNSTQYGTGQFIACDSDNAPSGWLIQNSLPDFGESQWTTGVEPNGASGFCPYGSFATNVIIDPTEINTADDIGFSPPFDQTLTDPLNYSVLLLSDGHSKVIKIARLISGVTPFPVNGTLTANFTIPAVLDDTVSVFVTDTTGIDDAGYNYVVILANTTEHGQPAYIVGTVDSVVDANEFVFKLKGIIKGATFGDEMLAGGTAWAAIYKEGCEALVYTPGDPGDWDVSPTTVQEALDRIADVVSVGGSVPIP